MYLERSSFKPARNAICAVILVLVLDGCAFIFPSVPSSPLALQVNAEHFLLAFCTDVTISGAHLSARDFDSDESFETVWEIEGTGAFRKGDVIDLAKPGDGFTQIVSKPIEIAPAMQYSVQAIKADSDSTLIAGFPPLTDDKVESNLWLHPDGSMSEEPCPLD